MEDLQSGASEPLSSHTLPPPPGADASASTGVTGGPAEAGVEKAVSIACCRLGLSELIEAECHWQSLHSGESSTSTTAGKKAADRLANAEENVRTKVQEILATGSSPSQQKADLAEELESGVAQIVSCFSHYLYLWDSSPSPTEALLSYNLVRALSSIREALISLPPYEPSDGGDEVVDVLKAGTLATAVITTLLSLPTTDGEVDSRLLALAEAIIDELVSKTWGVANAWGDSYLAHVSPLIEAARKGNTRTLSLILSKRPVTKVADACVAAYRFCHEAAFDLLTSTGPCLDPDTSVPLVFRLAYFLCAEQLSLKPSPALPGAAPEDAREICYRMLDAYIQRWPESVKDPPSLALAVKGGEAPLVRRLLEAGTPIIYELQPRRGADKKKAPPHPPTLEAALGERIVPAVIDVLIDHGALDQTKYSDAASARIATRIAALAVSAFPRNAGWTGSRQNLPEENSAHLQVIEKVLAKGWSYCWDARGRHTLLDILFRKGEKCLLREEHVITLLKLYRAAGADSTLWQTRCTTYSTGRCHTGPGQSRRLCHHRGWLRC
jgi:hypothetical protein